MASEYRDDLAAALARADASRQEIEEKTAEVERQKQAVAALSVPVAPGSRICRGCGFVGQPRPMWLMQQRLALAFILPVLAAWIKPSYGLAVLMLLATVAAVASLFVSAYRPVRCPSCKKRRFELPEVLAREKQALAALADGSCLHCRRPVDRDARFCPACGVQQRVSDEGCRACGTLVPAGARYCARCGRVAE